MAVRKQTGAHPGKADPKIINHLWCSGTTIQRMWIANNAKGIFDLFYRGRRMTSIIKPTPFKL